MRTQRFVFGLSATVVSLVLCGGCGRAGGQQPVAIFQDQIRDAIQREYAGTNGAAGSGDLREIYVAPNGSATGDGTVSKPLNLSYMFTHPAALKPGSIVWMRGGKYQGNFTSETIGRRGAPIVFRSYPGERVILDGCRETPTAEATLTVNGEYTWFWGLEITNCRGVRKTATAGPAPPDLGKGAGVNVFGTDVKLISLIIHDNALGVGAWSTAKRLEISNCLIFYNGWDGPDRGHGHGIYVQNEIGTRKIAGNIIFHQFGIGIHAYGESTPVNHVHLERNIAFMNGSLSARSGLSRNVLVGAQKGVADTIWDSNATYYPLSGGGSNELGYGLPCTKAQLRDNYLVGPVALAASQCDGLIATGNAFIGQTPKFWPSSQPDNEYFEKPSHMRVEFRWNKWEPDRAYFAVYNWEHKGKVQVDISKLRWEPGQKYRLRNVQNYFEDILRGVYTGEPIEVPMEGWKIAHPIGAPPPPSTFPEFGAFVIESDDIPEPREQTAITENR